MGVSKRFEIRGRFSIWIYRIVNWNSDRIDEALTALIFLVDSLRMKNTDFPSCVLPCMLPNGMYEDPELEVLGPVSFVRYGCSNSEILGRLSPARELSG